MKSKFFATMALTFLLVGSTAIPSLADVSKDAVLILNIGKPTMQVSGVEKKLDSQNEVTPVLVNDTAVVPIRAIIEALGGKVQWEYKERKVTISYNNKVVEFWLNKRNARVNGKEMDAKIAPKSINGRTMIPLRFVSEGLGLCVNWEGSTKAISVSSSSDYVAIVGSSEVKKAEYNIFLSSAKNNIMNSISQNPNGEISEGNIWDTQIDGMKAGDLAKQTALVYARQQKIFLSYAKENKVTLSNEDLKSIDTSISEMINQEGGKEAAEKKIKENSNVNLSEYTAFLIDNQLVNKYLDGV
ncbi:MAG TPA: copper amine oxidase N-terminal domain-containing protein [Ruminiclostridium sp.]